MATPPSITPASLPPATTRRFVLPGRALAVLATLLLVLAGCSGDDAGGAGGGEPNTLRLGYFPNLTHATALVGLQKGIFQAKLGDTKLDAHAFNAGPAVTEALFSGALDASYIGPNPAINAFTKSNGEAVRIISGATSGGAALVVKPGIKSAADLRGKTLSTPQLGNTQDVALRAWLDKQGLKTTKEGGGDVKIQPQENAQSLETFQAGKIDGAWVPEPWATRLELDGGGKVLVDEATLWPQGRYVTTHLIVRTEYLRQHPAEVEALLRGQVEANELVNTNPAEAQKLVNDGIKQVTGKSIDDAVLSAAWKRLEFTNDPIADSLRTSAANAKALGFLSDDNLEGIYDLSLLNKVLAEQGATKVDT